MSRTASIPTRLLPLLALASLSAPAIAWTPPPSAATGTTTTPASAAATGTGSAVHSDEENPAGAGAGTGAPAQAIADAAIEPWRLELLDRAFDVASALPAPLHVKDRARAQQAVVSAMLELDQPLAAVAYITQIPDWRRGDAYADLAHLRARRGDHADSRGYLALAEQIALNNDDWRRDRIRVNIARTHVLLGRDEVAEGMEVGVVPSETGVVDAVRVQTMDREQLAAELDARLDEYGRQIDAGGFDLARNLLVACVELYERFYDSPEQRDRIRDFIVASWSRLPVDLRVARMLDLADVALAREDAAVARPLVDLAGELVDGVRMTAEGWVPLAADVARRRAELGDVGRAASELDAALARFDAERATIIDMFRAEVLRPVAEAYMAMGEREAAGRVYRLALDEGAANPNARPRAQDLSATLTSMARTGFRPDDVLAARIDGIHANLGAPW